MFLVEGENVGDIAAAGVRDAETGEGVVVVEFGEVARAGIAQYGDDDGGWIVAAFPLEFEGGAYGCDAVDG